MRKQTMVRAALVMTALMPVVSSLRAQSGGFKANIGPVTFTWGQPGRLEGNKLFLTGGVHMASANYDLQSQTVTVSFHQGSFGITQAVAVGDAAKNKPVTGRFSSLAQAQTYIVTGDKAVYVPVPGRKDGGQIDFTGNVVITVRAPQALDGPAITKVGQATVLVGEGADYPQIDFGAGTATFTPLQGH